jgi:hypothetical protein
MYGRNAQAAGLEGTRVPPGTKMALLFWNTTTQEPYEYRPGSSFPR